MDNPGCAEPRARVRDTGRPGSRFTVPSEGRVLGRGLASAVVLPGLRVRRPCQGAGAADHASRSRMSHCTRSRRSRSVARRSRRVLSAGGAEEGGAKGVRGVVRGERTALAVDAPRVKGCELPSLCAQERGALRDSYVGTRRLEVEGRRGRRRTASAPAVRARGSRRLIPNGIHGARTSFVPLVLRTVGLRLVIAPLNRGLGACSRWWCSFAGVGSR